MEIVKYHKWKKISRTKQLTPTLLADPNIDHKGASTFSKSYMVAFSGVFTDVHDDENISADEVIQN